MRLLLILALLAASLGFGPPASARSHHDRGEHASHAATHDHGLQNDREEQGKGHAVVHVCPGCAFLGAPTLPQELVVSLRLPRLPANPPSLRSFDANPIPPPPREA